MMARFCRCNQRRLFVLLVVQGALSLFILYTSGLGPSDVRNVFEAQSNSFLSNPSVHDGMLEAITAFEEDTMEDTLMAFDGSDADALLLRLGQIIMHKSMPEVYSVALPGDGLYVGGGGDFVSKMARIGLPTECHRPDTVVVGVAITRHDARFLQEWVVFHLGMGYDHFLLYWNAGNYSDNTEVALLPFVQAGLVTMIPWPGQGQQDEAYNHAIALLQRAQCSYVGRGSPLDAQPCPEAAPLTDSAGGGGNTIWMATHDIDEFMYTPHVSCIQDVLAPRKEFGGVMVYRWFHYHNGRVLEEAGSRLLTRYAHHDKSPDSEVKVIANVRFLSHNMHPHRFAYTDYHFAVDEDGLLDSAMEEGYRNPYVNHTTSIEIHHFVTKSLEALVMKFLRGRAHIDEHWPPELFLANIQAEGLAAGGAVGTLSELPRWNIRPGLLRFVDAMLQPSEAEFSTMMVPP